MSVFAIKALRRQGDFALDAEFAADGKVVALFGPSGAGKSTILRIIAGLQRPDSGRIEIGGRVVFDSTIGIDMPACRRRIGFVFQDGLLFPHLSVRQNLFYGSWARGIATPGAEIARTIDILGIGPLLDRAPRNLSGGERQRVAIGRALFSDASVLLMDEPVAAVDLERRAEILPFLQALTKETSVPILYVSHALSEIEQLADCVVKLRDGRVEGISRLR